MELEMKISYEAIANLAKSIPNMTKYRNYQNMQVIGNGQFSKVFQAQTNIVSMNNQNEYEAVTVALKLIPIQAKNSKKLYDAITTEINLLKNIKSQNVVKVIDNFEDDHYIGVATEFCEEGNLLQVMKNPRRSFQYFTEKEAMQFFLQIYTGVSDVHSQTIIIRNLRIESVMVSKGIAKIIDLGLTKDLQQNINNGLYLYQAPEVLEKKEYLASGFKLDVFNLGVILYQMLQMQVPFQENSQQFQYSRIQQQTQFSYSIIDYPLVQNPISSETKNLIYSMLKYDPAQRIDWKDIIQNEVIQLVLNQGIKSVITNSDYYIQDYQKEQNMIKVQQQSEIEKHISQMKLKNYNQSVVEEQKNQINSSQVSLNNENQVDQVPTLKKNRTQQINQLIEKKVSELQCIYNNININTLLLVRIQEKLHEGDENTPIIQYLLTKKLLTENQEFKKSIQVQLQEFQQKTELEKSKLFQVFIQMVDNNLNLLEVQNFVQQSQGEKYINKSFTKQEQDIIKSSNIKSEQWKQLFKREFVSFYKYLMKQLNYIRVLIAYLALFTIHQDSILSQLASPKENELFHSNLQSMVFVCLDQQDLEQQKLQQQSFIKKIQQLQEQYKL